MNRGGSNAVLAAEPSAYVVTEDDGTSSMNLLVDDVHCGHCIQKIESAMKKQPGVFDARVNLSTRTIPP